MSFLCPACGVTSCRAEDEREGYCGRCRLWTAQLAALEGTVFGFAPPGDVWFERQLDAVRVPAPVGWLCLHCAEPIREQDTGFFRPCMPGNGYVWKIRAVHAQCEALHIVGHDNGVCSCTGYDTTAKASADELWRRLGHRLPEPDNPRPTIC